MNSLPVESKIACCKACLLASYMKDCKNCAFKVGLIYKHLDQLRQAESSIDRKGKSLLDMRKKTLILS